MKKKSSFADLDDLLADTGSRRVYSTETGRICPDCDHPVDACQCDADIAPEGDGFVRLQLDRKGRKGKGVTLITGVLLKPSELKAYAKKLKNRCGTGGTVKEGVIEIQGDQRDVLQPLLQQDGYAVKRVGG